MPDDVIAFHLAAIDAKIGELVARQTAMNGAVSDVSTRVSVLEPSVTAAHERIDNLDVRVEGNSTWISRADGMRGGMRELITVIAAAIAAAASLLNYLKH